MTLVVDYSKVIPYPFDVILSQYFDYEHIAHVHPESLGEYRLLSQDGNVIEYEQIWPGRWRRKRSVIRHTFFPPNEMAFEFISGSHKGTVVRTKLTAQDDKSTLVDESYHIPGLPNWGWLRKWIRPSVLATVEHVWQEDLDVEVCFNGWPGVPGAEPGSVSPSESEQTGEWISVVSIESLGEKPLARISVEGHEITLVQHNGEWIALEAHCPHTGGPLGLGWVDEGSVVCPWHGARFDLQSGACTSGPSPRGIKRFPTRIDGDRLMVRIQ